MNIKRPGRGNLFRILYRNPSPARATRAVQSLLSIFIESGVGGKRRDSQQARQFLDQQISAYESKLADAENRLKEFKLKNMNLNAGHGPDYFGDVSTLAE